MLVLFHALGRNPLLGHLMYSRLRAIIASVTHFRILSKLLTVTLNLSETDLIASRFEMNQMNIKPCFSSGIDKGISTTELTLMRPVLGLETQKCFSSSKGAL